MATWDEIIADSDFQLLSPEGQTEIRARWFDATVAPEFAKEGLDAEDIAFQRNKAIQNYDNGQGYVSSFAGSAGRGVANTGTVAVQGLGVLTNDFGTELAGREMEESVPETNPVNPEREKT